MACSKKYLCLKLHDHIKIKSHGDRSAGFPSVLRIICSGCHAMAVFSLRNDAFALPMVGSATCWKFLSGEPLVAQVTATPGASYMQCSLQRGECYKSPVFSKIDNVKGHPSFSAPQSRERLGLTGLSPSLSHRE